MHLISTEHRGVDVNANMAYTKTFGGLLVFHHPKTSPLLFNNYLYSDGRRGERNPNLKPCFGVRGRVGNDCATRARSVIVSVQQLRRRSMSYSSICALSLAYWLLDGLAGTLT